METLHAANEFITNHKFKTSLTILENFTEKEIECSEASDVEHRPFPKEKILMPIGSWPLCAMESGNESLLGCHRFV